MSDEIERIKNDLKWGNTVPKALNSSAKRVHSRIVSRVLLLAERSSKAVSDLGEILEILIEDVSMSRTLKERRLSKTLVYALIIYFTFGVFLLTSFSISNYFIPPLPRSGAESVTEASFVSGSMKHGNIETIFFHASMIQGFSSGLIAGKLRKGEILAGLKSSLFMVFIAWTIFNFLV